MWKVGVLKKQIPEKSEGKKKKGKSLRIVLLASYENGSMLKLKYIYQKKQKQWNNYVLSIPHRYT